MTYLICIIACAAFMSIKGGQLGNFRAWKSLKDKNVVTDFLMDGSVVSAILFGILVYFLGATATESLLAAVLWFAGNAPSMGEEAGAIGGVKGAWGEYLDWMPTEKKFMHFWKIREGRSFGWKKGTQRGLWTGAMIMLVFTDTWFIPAGISFPLLYFVGISAAQLMSGQIRAGWHWSEPLFGAALGVALGHHFALS